MALQLAWCVSNANRYASLPGARDPSVDPVRGRLGVENNKRCCRSGQALMTSGSSSSSQSMSRPERVEGSDSELRRKRQHLLTEIGYYNQYHWRVLQGDVILQISETIVIHTVHYGIYYVRTDVSRASTNKNVGTRSWTRQRERMSRAAQPRSDLIKRHDIL